MDQPTLVFATIARPESAIRLIRSVRSFFPDMPIEMVEQVDGESALEAVCRSYGVGRTVVPFDAGLSASRNAALAKVKTEHIILADDDFIFTGDTNWTKAQRFMAKHPEVVFVGGELESPAKGAGMTAIARARNLALDTTAKGLLMIPATEFAQSRVTFDGEVFLICDMVPNWGLARADILREIRWDERFKIGGEHLDFFLRLKQRSPAVKVAATSCIRAEHHAEASDSYRTLRERDDWVGLFAEKWNLDYILPVGGNMRRFRDYGRSVPLWSDAAAAGLIERQATTIVRQREALARQASALARKDELIRRLKGEP
jgi:glycosyltransferase involved in cell wall biosynthesis